jgi:hypothetical protein
MFSLISSCTRNRSQQLRLQVALLQDCAFTDVTVTYTLLCKQKI